MSRAREPEVSDVFFALGDGTRLSLVRSLGSGEALSATALSGGARITRQAIVKHLQVLEEAGLVSHEKRGREVLYVLETERLDEARLLLEAISARWDRAIERLRDLVEERPPRKKSPNRPARSLTQRR